MPKRSSLAAITALAAASAGAIGAYAYLIRPWHLRWGATDEEVRRWLPGDDLVPNSKLQATHAITVHAPVAGVWPWLIQMGQGRGGFYSYGWIENVLGLNMRNADRIIPDLQNLHAADEIPLAPGGTVSMPVDIVIPQRALVMHTEQPPPIQSGAAQVQGAANRIAANRIAVIQPGYYRSVTWSFYLNAVDEKTTRLIERLRADWDSKWSKTLAIRGFLEPSTFVMQRGMLLGIKERAETAFGRQAAC